MSIVIVGHVDHGKSTLVGRLLFETGSLPDGKMEEIVASSRRRGVDMEWSYVMDALQAERDQAVTIDTTRVWFRFEGRRYAVIDAPGHRQFIANMLSGAADAEIAILVVDAVEGVSEETRRHAYLLQILEIEQVIVAVNKMDQIGFEEHRFASVGHECSLYLSSLGLRTLGVVPIAGRDGDNLVRRSDRMPWYGGPTLMETLSSIETTDGERAGDLRLRVQDVYRSGPKRIAVGRIESGYLSVGDVVVASPSGSKARVRTIERWPAGGPVVAHPGESIGFTVYEPLYIERGDVISNEDGVPTRGSVFAATFFWLAESPPEFGELFRLQFGPSDAAVTLEAIERVVDTQTLGTLPTTSVPQYAVVEARLRSSAILALDTRATNTATSRCVLLRGEDVVAGGFVSRVTSASRARNVYREDHLVSRNERAARNGHEGAVVWLTGLSGAGKSTLAMALERRLFGRGCFVYVLDGDNVRSGLNSDLSFSAEDRTENI
ncbi:MAG: adenylyl-sulfate kinase, partial [Candidatus Eremiobacteraeota bacterium]|nr:adenylyl-sulfate kinase [Candidatus Eremiobacteraeota bacterium]